MKPSLPAFAAALAVLFALPLPAPAQDAVSPSPGAAGGDAATPHPLPDAEQSRRQAQVEHRIADLHSKLHITDAQKSSWDRFAQVMRDNARNMDQTFEQRSKRVNDMTAIENMQSYAQVAEEHAQDVQKLAGAFQTLYESMSPDQKQTADQLFRNYTEHAQQRGLGRRG